MNHREALLHVEQIREQLARAETFRVYRATSAWLTGLLALVGSAIQARWELNDPGGFVTLWLIIAGLCIGVVAADMRIRCLLSDSILLRDATLTAARQFFPCVVAGGMLTAVIYRFAPQAVILLPGLWGICFALGIFASRPGLPRQINFVGAFYLLASLLVIATTSGNQSFGIWPMPTIFGVGQSLAGIVLYFCSERVHEAQQ